MYRRKCWGGFVDGNLDEEIFRHYINVDRPAEMVRRPAVFKTRSDALQSYGDVRRIEIREVLK